MCSIEVCVCVCVCVCIRAITQHKPQLTVYIECLLISIANLHLVYHSAKASKTSYFTVPPSETSSYFLSQVDPTYCAAEEEAEEV